MRKEPLNSRRIQLINTHTQELHQDVDGLYENLIDGDFEFSMGKIEDLENKIKLIKGLAQEGHILKPKRR